MTTKDKCTQMFEIGLLQITPQALLTIDEVDFFTCFIRHRSGDWGDLDEQDWKANDDAVESGSRILSFYSDRRGNSFWIITEPDRSSTTVQLPEEFCI